MKIIFCIALILLLPSQVLASQHYLLIVSGIGGTEEYQKQFVEDANSLNQSALKLGIDEANIMLLDEGGPSSKKAILKAIEEIGTRADTEDRIFIVLIGHGNARDNSAVLNLPGPDLSAEELDEALNVLEDRSVIIVNTASASGPFIKVLSRDNRLVITATSSAREYHATVFGGFFFAAFAESGADRDKDEKISMLEAFDYARHEVRRSYESDKRLLTEHALLDDNGDGSGSLDPGHTLDKGGDGAMARRIFLQPPWSLASGARPETIALLRQKEQIEQSISSLKLQRESMGLAEYYDKLEVLLVDLALLTRQIRAEDS